MNSSIHYLILRCLRMATIFFVILAFLRFTYYSCTEGFSLNRIQNRIQERPELKQDGPSERELTKMQELSQEPYHYLKKGSQAYAFTSGNDRYILKLYKCHHLQSADWLLNIPILPFLQEWRDRLVERRRYKLDLTVTSFTIARDILKSECGILYTQILPMDSYSLPVTLIDSIGRNYEIDLAEYGFAFQRKAKLIFPTLEEWIASGDIESAKKALNSLVGLLARRSRQGIQDSDPDLHKNAGFVGTTAIFIDIGSFHRNQKIAEQEEMKRDIHKITKNLVSWLEGRNAELADYLKSLINEPWKADWDEIPAKD